MAVGHLERLLFTGEPAQDFSEQVARILRIPALEAERICNEHLQILARQHKNLRNGVRWALNEAERLGEQMLQEFDEERVA
jgi:hypothetical protein